MGIRRIDPSDHSGEGSSYSEHARETERLKQILIRHGTELSHQEIDALISSLHHAYSDTKAAYEEGQNNPGDRTATELTQHLHDQIDRFKKKVDDTLSNLLENPSRAHLDEIRSALFSIHPEGEELRSAYRLSVTHHKTAWPGAIQAKKGHKAEAIQSVGPKQDVPPGCVSMKIQLQPGVDPDKTFIRLQGQDPTTGRQCYITWDANGNPAYVDINDMANNDPPPAKYCIPVSQLPRDGNTLSITIPQLTSGRVYVSQGGALTQNAPSFVNPDDADVKTKWTMMEVNNDQRGITADVSAVDVFSSPGLQMQMFNNDFPSGGPVIGYGGDAKEFLAKVKGYFGDSIWNTLFQGDSKILSPKHFTETFKTYYNHYLQTTFLPYYQNHPIVVKEPIDGITTTLTGTVVGDNFEFRDPSGTLIATIPTSSDDSIPWFTGSSNEWPPGKGNLDTQRDLMRDLSSLLNSGIKPDDPKAQFSESNPLTRDFFKANRDLFYQASDDGVPMYNVYDYAMHKAGYEGYTYDYNDLQGIDGTQFGETGSNASLVLTIGA